jgi:hypothetical protein
LEIEIDQIGSATSTVGIERVNEEKGAARERIGIVGNWGLDHDLERQPDVGWGRRESSDVQAVIFQGKLDASCSIRLKDNCELERVPIPLCHRRVDVKTFGRTSSSETKLSNVASSINKLR